MSFSPTKSIAKTLKPLKRIPYLPIFFDSQLKIYTLFFRPKTFEKMMELVNKTKSLPDIKTKHHKYGGLEFRVNKKEVCHMHGDGLLDILLNRDSAQKYIKLGLCNEHHVIPNSGWVSCQINTITNTEQVLKIIKLAYDLRLK